MRVLIRGAGDLASGIALRLHRAGLDVVMTDLEKPTAIRRTVCFSQALVLGAATVEDVTARAAASAAQAEEILAAGEIPVLADPACTCREALRPDALVDAILAKRNLGMRIGDAPVVIGVGPGFTVGEDCHAVVETMRGHTLGRVIYRGSAIPNKMCIRDRPCPHRRQADESLHPSDRQAGGETYRHGRGPFRL